MNAVVVEAPSRVHPHKALRELVSERGNRTFADYRELTTTLAVLPVDRRLEARVARGEECERDCFMVGNKPYLVFWGEGDGVGYFPAR